MSEIQTAEIQTTPKSERKGVRFSDNLLVFQIKGKSFEPCLVWHFRVQISDIAPKSKRLETKRYLEHQKLVRISDINCIGWSKMYKRQGDS